MSAKSPAIIFPEKQQPVSVTLHFSKDDIRSLCNLQPFSLLSRSMCNYAIQKDRTKQRKKQLEAMAAATAAEYSELENQAAIHFHQLTERLAIEFEKKKKMLDIELQKAELEADKHFQEHQVEFEKYLKTSTIYKTIFDELKKSAVLISEIIQFAEKEDIATNTRKYIQFCEQYRQLLRGIEKYSKLSV